MYYDQETGFSLPIDQVPILGPQDRLRDRPPPPPPAVPAVPPRTPPAEVIDEAYVFKQAQENLPKREDFLDFVKSFSHDALPRYVGELVRRSGVNEADFQAAMAQWASATGQAEKALNAKAPPPAAPVRPLLPMPGVGADVQCTSIFDINDLSMRGRKSVLVKRFFVPVLMPQVLLKDDQKWGFGQKIEYRQEWRHEGFTLGELISSLSLLPNEELTLDVNSWQRTKKEISEETDEQTRRAEEREAARTDELSAVSEAASNQSWTVSASGSVSYGPVASLNASATKSGSVSERAEQASRTIREATTRATHEVSLRRAVKITQAEEAGSENRTTRRIRNPNQFHTVTFNFFQVVKLYDVQLRLVNDAPVLMLPGLFPARYDLKVPEGTSAEDRARQYPLDGRPVRIPYHAVEAFTSPAVFLTQYFEVDRELSESMFGLALRVRIDPGLSPAGAVAQLAAALVVGTRYLLGINPLDAVLDALAAFLAHYADNAQDMRRRSAEAYGPGRGRSEQISTSGIYADSMMGRCSAGEDYAEASRYFDVLRQQQDVEKQMAENNLAEQEVSRRQKLLAAGKLEPFTAPADGAPT
jgi:hypothetical protein